MKQNKYLPKQMNGLIVNSYAQSLDDEFSDSEKICDYLYNLSINTANDDELDSIGLLIGYPRPLVPEGFKDGNLFLFGSEPIESDSEIGFSTVGEDIGGHLTTAKPTLNSYKMESGLYRKFLERIAIIKRYGITIKSVDLIASLISKNYKIYFNEDSDIVISYKNQIGFKNLWVLTNLFYRFCTIPQVLVFTNEDENNDDEIEISEGEEDDSNTRND